MVLKFLRKGSIAARKEDRFEGEGVFVIIEGQRHQVPDLSLGGLVFSGPPASLRQSHEIAVDLVLPMAVGERLLPVTLRIVRMLPEAAACAFIKSSYSELMSIRQFVLRKRNEADRAPTTPQ